MYGSKKTVPLTSNMECFVFPGLCISTATRFTLHYFTATENWVCVLDVGLRDSE